MPDATKPLPGIEPESLVPWLAQHVEGGLRPPLDFTLVAGGRSNLTYLITDATGRRVVLRRPPTGNVLESAHDMGREHLLIAALAPTPVPVPAPLAVCDDPAITGGPFYVMEFVDGAILRSEEDVEAAFDVPKRTVIADSLVDVLADIHAVEPDAVGLGGLRRRTGYAERQLRRWHGQFEQSKSREVPDVDEVHRRLVAAVPTAHRDGLVHGDYRIDNCVLAPDGTVAAVLDWELCTIGDPLADVGMLVVYWARPLAPSSGSMTGAPTEAPGFPEVGHLLDRYAARTGADMTDIDFYIALGFWKLACIAEGIFARYTAGVMGDDEMPAEFFGDQVFQFASSALDVTDRMR